MLNKCLILYNMTTRKISVQIFSDIHAESWNQYFTLPIKSKYLFLAGDICNKQHPFFYKFLDYCSLHWEKVFYIPGHNEFYIKNKNYNELLFEYKYEIEKRYKNIYFIHNEVIKLNDEIDVYGCIFWTKSPFNNKHQAKLFINDYNYITYFNEITGQVTDLDTSYINKISEMSYNCLKNYLTSTKKKCIVMTHFPPIRTGTTDPLLFSQYRKANEYFTWPDETINDFNLSNVPIWISGHTHWSYDITKENTRFISNQLGYKNEMGQTNLDVDGLFEIIF